MTILYNGNIRNLFLGRAIRPVFASTFAISIYSGVQPAAANIISSWTTYAGTVSNFLNHYNGAAWTQPSSGPLLQLTLPTAQAALNSGLASWAILWSTNASLVSVQGATIPTDVFMVVPCSDSVGQGVIRFTNPNLISGVFVGIQDGSMGSYLI